MNGPRAKRCTVDPSAEEIDLYGMYRICIGMAMSSTEDHLGILGLSNSATKAEIKKAYHKVCR